MHWIGVYWGRKIERCRASQILRAATDGCRMRPWLASLPTSVSGYWRCSQILTVISVQFLSPILSNVSSGRTWCRWVTFVFLMEPVSFNLLDCLQIVGPTGIRHRSSGHFTLNLRRVWEHDFLLFIYVLWIYIRSHNENSCLGMSQITITTLTAPTSDNNHNQ